MASSLSMDEGEWAEAAFDATGLEAPWDNLTGGTLTLYAERRSPTAAVMTPVAGSLDAAGTDGKVHGAKAMIPTSWVAGRYFCTLTLTKAGDGYPQKESFDLTIREVASAPA